MTERDKHVEQLLDLARAWRAIARDLRGRDSAQSAPEFTEGAAHLETVAKYIATWTRP
jgi:hypothetical protein